MSLFLKLGRHFLAALNGPTITDVERDLIRNFRVAGFTLYSRNITEKKQIIDLNKELQSLARQKNYTLILAVDQEGGRIARLKAPEFTEIPPMRFFGEEYARSKDLTALQKAITTLCVEMKTCGFNLNYAPLVDIDLNPQSPIIGDRSFSSDPEIVTTLAREVIQIHNDHGLLTCLKHFPGHGLTSTDSHLERATDNRALDELMRCDLIPYASLFTFFAARRRLLPHVSPAIMTAHVDYPKIDADRTATLSPKILGDILRGRLKYDGVILSDDFLMKAIASHYSLMDATKQFFLASGDVALICNEPEKILDLLDELSVDLTDRNAGEETKKIVRLLEQSEKRLERWNPAAFQ